MNINKMLQFILHQQRIQRYEEEKKERERVAKMLERKPLNWLTGQDKDVIEHMKRKGELK